MVTPVTRMGSAARFYTKGMETFAIASLLPPSAERAYREFLRVPALSMGLYVLPAAGEDPQQPHAQDEVYYVLAGRAAVRIGEEEQPVEPGTLVYVPANVPHRF